MGEPCASKRAVASETVEEPLVVFLWGLVLLVSLCDDAVALGAPSNPQLRLMTPLLETNGSAVASVVYMCLSPPLARTLASSAHEQLPASGERIPYLLFIDCWECARVHTCMAPGSSSSSSEPLLAVTLSCSRLFLKAHPRRQRD